MHGKKLVYARGYAWGEPDWPVCQPTSRFRIASVSKTVTALAAYQLIGEGKLKLTDKVAGHPPAQDAERWRAGGTARFKDVTVRHLLEHTSGINANAFRNEVAILDAHKAAVPNGSWHLPVTAEMCDAYIASLDMGAEGSRRGHGLQQLRLLPAWPGGREEAGQGAPDRRLPGPPVRPACTSTASDGHPSLIATMPTDEARYRAQDIPVYPSVMSDDRPLVPLGYGTEHFERQEGGGGLSAAATDLGRLIAILLSQDDTARP